MRKDQVNVILEKVVEDSDTDAIDVRAYRGGSGYDDDNETEADQAYWNIELKVILWD